MWADCVRRIKHIVAVVTGTAAKYGFSTSWLGATYDHPYPANGAYIVETPASDASFKLQNLSVEIWYQIGTADAVATVVDMYTPDASSYGFKVILNDYAASYKELDCSMRFGGSASAANSLIGAISATTPGQWVHVVFTYASGSQVIYINGASVKTGAIAGPIAYSTTYGVYVNADQNGIGTIVAGSLTGTVAEAKVYNSVLAQSDVTTKYNAGPPSPPSGSKWTPYTPPVPANWSATCVCWSPTLNLFVAVASYPTTNTIMTSPDGITWTVRTIGTGNLQSVCWSPEKALFVAVRNNGAALESNSVFTSPDGINWTQQTTPSSYGFHSVCWSKELGIFCAVSGEGTTTNASITSPNGITWTGHSGPEAASMNQVCWSPALLIFCAANGTDMWTSPDGATWTIRPYSAVSTANFYSVTWSPEKAIFVAGSSNGANTSIITSPDGITWTARTSIGQGWNANRIAWAPEASTFVAVRSAGTGTDQVMTSPDGSNWTQQTAPNGTWNSVCWSPALLKFVAVANTGPKTMISA